MYEILTKLKNVETTQVGKNLIAYVKFRTGRDGMVDVHVNGLTEAVVSVERNGTGYKAFANDSQWIRCDNIDEIYDWTIQKLAEILASTQLS